MREYLNLSKKIKRDEIAAEKARTQAERAAAEALWNPKPAAPAETTPQPEQIDQGRRWFMRGAVATAAVAAIPTIMKPAEALAASPEPRARERTAPSESERIRAREREAELELQEIRAVLSSPAMMERRVGTGDQAALVFAAMNSRFGAEEMRGTKYDMSDIGAQTVVQIAYQEQGGSAYLRTYNSDPAAFKTEREAGYCDGFYLDRADHLFAPKHALDDMEKKPRQLGAYDIAIINGAPKARREQIIIDDPTVTRFDIEMQRVSVEAIDPDRTSKNKRKEYCNIAVGSTPELIANLFKNMTPEQRERIHRSDPLLLERLARSFMLVLPDGEAEGIPGQDLAKSRPATGTSGAPVFMWRQNKKVLVGMLHSVMAVEHPITRKKISVGFFHDIEALRRFRNEKMRAGA